MFAADVEKILGIELEIASMDELLARDLAGLACISGSLRNPPCRLEGPSFAADAGQASNASPAGPQILYCERDRILEAGPTDILYIGKADSQ